MKAPRTRQKEHPLHRFIFGKVIRIQINKGAFDSFYHIIGKEKMHMVRAETSEHKSYSSFSLYKVYQTSFFE